MSSLICSRQSLNTEPILWLILLLVQVASSLRNIAAFHADAREAGEVSFSQAFLPASTCISFTTLDIGVLVAHLLVPCLV